MGVPGPLRLRPGPGQELGQALVEGLRADPVHPGPGIGFVPHPERPGDRSRGTRCSITQAIVDGRSEIQWLIDGARSFTPANSFTLASYQSAAVRSFGAHESDGAWADLCRRRTDRHFPGNLVQDQAHLGVQPGARAEWGVTGCARAQDPESHGLRRLRRCSLRHHQHQVVPSERRHARSGSPRWTLVYQEPPVGPFNSGLRGMIVRHPRRLAVPALLYGRHRGRLPARRSSTGPATGQRTMSPGHPYPGMVSTLEFTPVTAITPHAGR